MLLALSSCSTNEISKKEPPPESPAYYVKPATRQISGTCLDENLKFLERKPETMKEFVAEIARASVRCRASEDDITEYVNKIIHVHGNK